MSFVLGFVGWPCSGKDEAAAYLQAAHGARRFGHSDFIRSYAVVLGIKIVQTAQISALFEQRAAVEGYGWIARIVAEQIVKLWTREPHRLVVVSGVRNLGEVEVYGGLPGFQLVRLEADFETRYRRWCARRRPGEQETSRDHLRAIEALPGNTNIPDLMKLPGPLIVNNGTKDEFHLALDKLVVGKD